MCPPPFPQVTWAAARGPDWLRSYGFLQGGELEMGRGRDYTGELDPGRGDVDLTVFGESRESKAREEKKT